MPVSSWSRESILQVLCRTVLFGGLSATDLDAVAGRVVTVDYASGQVVFLTGEQPKGIYVIAGGALRSARHNPDGREQVLSVDYPCATIGEAPIFDGGTWHITAVARGSTRLLFVPRADMLRLSAERPELLTRCLQVLASRVRDYAELVHTLSLHDVDRRLAWLILNEAIHRGVQTDSGLALELTFTHQEIACRVASVREMVTRAFGHLQKAGLITTRGRLVSIPDAQRLKEYVTNTRAATTVNS